MFCQKHEKFQILGWVRFYINKEVENLHPTPQSWKLCWHDTGHSYFQDNWAIFLEMCEYPNGVASVVCCFVFLACRLCRNSLKDPWWKGQGPREDVKWPGQDSICFTSLLIYYPSWRPSSQSVSNLFSRAGRSPSAVIGGVFHHGWMGSARSEGRKWTWTQSSWQRFWLPRWPVAFKESTTEMVISEVIGRRVGKGSQNLGPHQDQGRGFLATMGGIGRASSPLCLLPPVKAMLSVLSCFGASFVCQSSQPRLGSHICCAL